MIPQGIDFYTDLRGTPDLAEMVDYRPVDWVSQIRVPTLIIDVTEEELFDRTKNGHAVFELIAESARTDYKFSRKTL